MADQIIPAGQRTRVLWIFSSSVPGMARFEAIGTDGAPASGTIELVGGHWLNRRHETKALDSLNSFEKRFMDSDYQLWVTPDHETRITFRTRHFRAQYLAYIFIGMIGLAVISNLVLLLPR